MGGESDGEILRLDALEPTVIFLYRCHVGIKIAGRVIGLFEIDCLIGGINGTEDNRDFGSVGDA